MNNLVSSLASEPRDKPLDMVFVDLEKAYYMIQCPVRFFSGLTTIEIPERQVNFAHVECFKNRTQIKGGYKYDMSYMPGKLDMSTIRGANLEHS